MTARSKTWVPDKWSSAKTWILVPRQVWAPLRWRQCQAGVAANPGAPADGQCPSAWLLRETGDKHRNQTHCRHLLHASAYWMKPQMANNVFVGLATISYCSLKHRSKAEMRANRPEIPKHYFTLKTYKRSAADNKTTSSGGRHWWDNEGQSESTFRLEKPARCSH